MDAKVSPIRVFVRKCTPSKFTHENNETCENLSGRLRMIFRTANQVEFIQGRCEIRSSQSNRKRGSKKSDGMKYQRFNSAFNGLRIDTMTFRCSEIRNITLFFPE